MHAGVVYVGITSHLPTWLCLIRVTPNGIKSCLNHSGKDPPSVLVSPFWHFCGIYYSSPNRIDLDHAAAICVLFPLYASAFTALTKCIKGDQTILSCLGLVTWYWTKAWWLCCDKGLYTLKTPGSDLTRKGSLDARPIFGSDRPENQARLTWNPSQKDIYDLDFVLVWPRFRISLNQKWVWPRGTLSGSNLTPGVFRV